MLIKYYCYTIWNLFIQNLSRLIFVPGGGKMKDSFIQKMSIKKTKLKFIMFVNYMII